MGRFVGEYPQGRGVKCDVLTFSLSKFLTQSKKKMNKTIQGKEMLKDDDDLSMLNISAQFEHGQTPWYSGRNI